MFYWCSVEVEARLQVIQHPDGGLVAAIPVRDGTRVAAGEPILELDGSELVAEEAVLARQLLETRARLDRLSAEERDAPDIVFRDAGTATDDSVVAAIQADERRLFVTRREVLEQTMAQLAERHEQTGAWVDGMRRQAEATRRQLALVKEEARDKEALLERSLVPKREVSRVLREEARLEGVIGELEAEIARGLSAAAGYEIERLRLLADWRGQAQSEMRTLQPREAELEGRLRVMRTRLGRLVLRAPMAGVVHGLRVFTVGGVIAPGTEVASVVPEGVPLVLRVRVEAGRIRGPNRAPNGPGRRDRGPHGMPAGRIAGHLNPKCALSGRRSLHAGARTGRDGSHPPADPPRRDGRPLADVPE